MNLCAIKGGVSQGRHCTFREDTRSSSHTTSAHNRVCTLWFLTPPRNLKLHKHQDNQFFQQDLDLHVHTPFILQNRPPKSQHLHHQLCTTRFVPSCSLHHHGTWNFTPGTPVFFPTGFEHLVPHTSFTSSWQQGLCLPYTTTTRVRPSWFPKPAPAVLLQRLWAITVSVPCSSLHYHNRILVLEVLYTSSSAHEPLDPLVCTEQSLFPVVPCTNMTGFWSLKFSTPVVLHTSLWTL